MKKIFTILVFLIILSNLAIALIDDPFDEKIDKARKTKENLESLAETNIDSNSIIPIFSSITDPFLKETVEIPRGFKTATKIVFGIIDNTELYLVIIALLIWAILVIIIAKTLQITDSFEGVTGWIVAIGLTIAVALSGSFNILTLWLLSLTKIFWPLGNWIGFSLLLVVTLLAAILILSTKLILIAKKENNKRKDEETKRNLRKIALQKRAY